MQETSHKEITLNTRLNHRVKHVHIMIYTKFDFSHTLGHSTSSRVMYGYALDKQTKFTRKGPRSLQHG
jgi:hypothetical protein